jgi:cAMP-dependent protein kinase regulator
MNATLVDVFRIRTYAAGEALLTQGDPGRGLFVLLRGTCEVSHVRSDGGLEPYPAMHEGDVFGELSLLYGGKVTANVRTASTCVVLELQSEWFDELLLGDPEVRARIYAIAGERFQRTQDFIAKEELEKRLV